MESARASGGKNYKDCFPSLRKYLRRESLLFLPLFCLFFGSLFFSSFWLVFLFFGGKEEEVEEIFRVEEFRVFDYIKL